MSDAVGSGVVMHRSFANQRVAREGCRGVFSEADYVAVQAFFARRPDIRPTPLHRLPSLARRLGLRALLIKDESHRMGLNAFKGGRGLRHRPVDGRAATRRRSRADLRQRRQSRSRGRARRRRARPDVLVYMSAATAPGPRRAIEAEGARVVLLDGSYDEAVERATADAAASGALVVSDTAWPGYETIPHDIMAGYTRIFEEAHAAWDEPPDTLIVQAGVGSLAAAAAAWASDRFGANRPCFVCCEPLSADPLLQSARAGAPTTSTQPMDTMMSGLRCSVASSLAIPILLRAADVFVSIDDEWTREAMRLLARPQDGDPAIVAGPSGAAGLGALLAICDRHPGARVLLVNTEGATDRQLCEEVPGRDPIPDGTNGFPVSLAAPSRRRARLVSGRVARSGRWLWSRDRCGLARRRRARDGAACRHCRRGGRRLTQILLGFGVLAEQIVSPAERVGDGGDAPLRQLIGLLRQGERILRRPGCARRAHTRDCSARADRRAHRRGRDGTARSRDRARPAPRRRPPAVRCARRQSRLELRRFLERLLRGRGVAVSPAALALQHQLHAVARQARRRQLARRAAARSTLATRSRGSSGGCLSSGSSGACETAHRADRRTRRSAS